MDLVQVLAMAVQRGASDVHLSVGEAPVVRVDGKMLRTDGPALTAVDLEEAARIVPLERRDEYDANGEVDMAYAVEGVGRFRVSVYRQQGTPAIACRSIPDVVSSLQSLGLPEVLGSFCDFPNGLIVVTGPTGSGKSTTLAAIIDQINERYAKHIITLEDPIEFRHTSKRSVVHQREVGSDTSSFARGLRAALRQDPDVILVGEMRDLETIRICLQAAETGHLVLATLHTTDAASTIDRMIDVFPADQQDQVRVQLGAVLQGVVAQQLFKRRNSPGRVAAVEVLVATPAVRNLIREGKTHQVVSTIQTGGRLGMRTMESAVRELLDRTAVALEDVRPFLPEASHAAGGMPPAGYGSLVRP